MSRSRRAGGAARRGAVAGAIAGTVTAAAMYLAALLVGIRPLSDVLAEPVLALLLAPTAEAGSEPGIRSGVDLQRRRIPLALLGLGLLFMGARLLPRWYQAVVAAPEAGLSGPTPELTPVGNFYVVSKNFSDPAVA